MIRIHRDPNPPAIDAFTKQTKADREIAELRGGNKITRAQDELAQAIAFFTDPANFKNDQNDTKVSKKTCTFKVYRDPAVIKALEAVFGAKCAYCESRFAHVTPKDIEHFRPKSAIENKDSPPLLPGYFWLAGEWTNLLVSCPDCNRARNREVPRSRARRKRSGWANRHSFRWKMRSVASARIRRTLPPRKREQIRKLKAHLAKRAAMDPPYLAMVRDYIRRTKAADKFDDLIQAGIDPENLLAS